MHVAEDQSEKAAYCVILAILLSTKNQVLEILRLVGEKEMNRWMLRSLGQWKHRV